MINFKELFFSLDLFQFPLNFYINGREKNSSYIGVFFSIMIYIYLSVSFVQSDIFMKESPYIVSQSLETSNSGTIHFTNDTLLTFSVSDGSHNSYIDPSIFRIEFKYFAVKPDGLGSAISILEYKKLKPCSVDDMPSGNSSLFNSLSLNNSFCLENKNFDISGSPGEIEIKYFAVNILLCDNSTSNGTCKTPEEINSFFTKKAMFFGCLYHNMQIDYYDYKNPFKIAYKTEYQLIDIMMNKRNYIYLKNAKIQTDDGIIFKSISEKENFLFGMKESDITFRINQQAPIVQFIFLASKEKVEVSRKYEKLLETFGSLTGMTYFFSFPCAFLAKIATHVLNLRQVLNKFYLFPDLKKNKNKKNKRMKKVRVQNLDQNNKDKSNKRNQSKSIKEDKTQNDHSPHIILENLDLKKTKNERSKNQYNINYFKYKSLNYQTNISKF